MEIISIIFYSYLIGSIPTAFLVLKRNGINILNEGSGNVGTLNSYEVSKSKSVAILVLITDFLKGMLPLYITLYFFGENFIYLGISVISAVFAHCFSIWIGFKGGRGLATALGGSVLFVPQLPILWISFWLISFWIKTNIHFSSIFATFSLLVATIFFSSFFIEFSIFSSTELEYSIVVSLVLIIILIKHIEPLRNYIKMLQSQSRGNHE